MHGAADRAPAVAANCYHASGDLTAQIDQHGARSPISLPASARLGSGLTGEDPVPRGKHAKDDRELFIAKTGLDDQTAELDLAASIEPSFLGTHAIPTRLQPCQRRSGATQHPRCVLAGARTWRRESAGPRRTIARDAGYRSQLPGRLTL
jgi:hypothetical protein